MSYGALKSNFARRDFIQDVGWSGSEIPHTNTSRQYKVKLSPPPLIPIYKVSSSRIYILENVIPLPLPTHLPPSVSPLKVDYASNMACGNRICPQE
jgi:hypothetical protein